MCLSDGRNLTGIAPSSSHPQTSGTKPAPGSLQQLMRNSWEYTSKRAGAASLFMCFVLRAVWGGYSLEVFFPSVFKEGLREQRKVAENKRKIEL